MDELTRQIVLERLQDPQWLDSILAPYSARTPKGRTPPLQKEGRDNQQKEQRQEKRNLFWRPPNSGVNVRPSMEQLVRQVTNFPQAGISKNYAVPGGLNMDLRGNVFNFKDFTPRAHRGEAGLSYNTPNAGGRVGTTLRGSTLEGAPRQNISFNGYLNNLFGGRLSGGASSTLGVPGSTRANVQYNRQF